MALHDLSLWRDNRRTEFRIEGETFAEVMTRLAPYLHEDSHIAHTGTDSDVIRLALLRADVERKHEAFQRVLAELREAESSTIQGQLERGAENADTSEG